MAIRQEPATIEGFTGQGGSGGGAGDVRYIMHGHLAVPNAQNAAQAQLAVELPSVEKGTWRVGSDGTMETTWRLRDGLTWHDGAPFTSADMIFTFNLYKDPDLAHAEVAHTRRMQSAEAPDPLTLIIRWSAIDVEADRAYGLSPVPRHLLEPLYQTDKNAFVNSPRFTTEFVGLGPYQLTQWDRGVRIELSRFDAYFQGRPPLDRIVVGFIGDPNTMVANILAGAIDLIPPPWVAVDAALDLRRRWEGTGNQVRLDIAPFVVYHEIQYRSDVAKPANGLTNRLVRQALYQAIDRKGLADAIVEGVGPTADSWYRPDDPMRGDVETAIPQYPYDATRAQQLLAQAGWNRGADGVLVHGQTGERFETILWTRPRIGEKAVTVAADYWKAIGVDAGIYVVPPAREEDREYTSSYPGALMTASGIDVAGSGYLPRIDSREISGPANRWGGRNKGAYANPKVDELWERLNTTVDPRARLALQREQAQEILADVAGMMLYWEVGGTLALRGVKADITPTNPGWNAFEWDKTP